jgi:hypothetical protein
MWLPEILRPRVKVSPITQYHSAYFYPVGSGNAVYEPAPPVIPAMLPIVNFSGAGVLFPHSPNPVFGPQMWANQTTYVAGVGGPLSGGMYTQPLNIPDTTNGSQ